MESLKLEELIHGFEEYAAQHGLPRPAAIEVGKRPGEKLHEELTSPHEVESLYEWGNLYAILPEPENILIFAKSICPDISLIKLLLLQKTELPKLLKTCIKKKA